MTGPCPVRRLVPPGESSGPAVEQTGTGPDERWVVRSFEVARQVLRESENVRQAGFGAEQVERAGARMRPPILYLHGPQHRAQRKAAARFFAPKVTEDYRELMEQLSQDLVGRLRTDVAVDLATLSMEMAVQVAGRVIGLDSSSRRGLIRRLDAFFDHDDTAGRLRGQLSRVRRNTTLLRFFWLDVKPAIRARRRRRREDVISQLLDQEFSDVDILTECVTYGAAGMATTRELITVAAWHLLDDPELLGRYRAGTKEDRLDIVQETLRLEPVVGHLYRRTAAPLTLSTPTGDHTVATGALIDLDIRAVNADATVVGADGLRLCPGRELPRAVPPTVMSFGDGDHKCPGAPLAIMETEIFLSTLLASDVVAEGPPRARWNPVTAGYDLDTFLVRLHN